MPILEGRCRSLVDARRQIDAGPLEETYVKALREVYDKTRVTCFWADDPEVGYYPFLSAWEGYSTRGLPCGKVYAVTRRDARHYVVNHDSLSMRMIRDVDWRGWWPAF